jgi:hypothetical protein
VHEANGRDENRGDADGDEGMPGSEAKRLSLELRVDLLAEIGAIEQGQREQIELLDDEAEGDNGDPGA